VWASIAFAQAHHGEPAAAAGQRAVTELLGVHPNDLGDDRKLEYTDAIVRVSASRWASAVAARQPDSLMLSAAPGEAGQTCVSLRSPKVSAGPLAQRCSFGIPWLASTQVIAEGQAVVLAVQPLEGWRELWVFHKKAGAWIVEVLPPGINDPELGYIEYAGYVPATRRLLVALEVKERGHFRRTFEELRLDDLVTIRQASSPDLLRDFGRWQDANWRRDTLALH
jgi:hypothetical protein